MIAIDQLDARLIGILSRDARAGVTEIARELGVARNTVQQRMRRLEESGVVRGYRPDVDLAAAGLEVQAFIALELVQGRLRVVADELCRFPEVLEIHVTTGREDLLLRVATTTQAKLQELLERVYDVAGVAHSSTSLTMTTPLPYRVLPLLAAAAERTGFGRATPPADAAADGAPHRPAERVR